MNPEPRAPLGHGDGLVDEIGEESFPASDPPAWSGMHAGAPSPSPGERPKAAPAATSGGGTRIDEIAPSIYRISTPIPPNPGLPMGFTFNQFLVVDDQPTLFHTGHRRLFPAVREAVARVISPSKLRWISFSHLEADESGALLEWLTVAPDAVPLCSAIGAKISVEDAAGKKPRVLAPGETLSIGAKRLLWFDTPHLPHGWDSGFLAEETTRTLFCGDLFTQPGDTHPPVTEGDILGPSEAMRSAMDYYANPRAAAAQIEPLARFQPSLLACMHGASFRGDCAGALRALGAALAAR